MKSKHVGIFNSISRICASPKRLAILKACRKSPATYTSLVSSVERLGFKISPSEFYKHMVILEFFELVEVRGRKYFLTDIGEVFSKWIDRAPVGD